MSVLIDVIIIAVFLFPVFKYWHKGLMQAILGVGKFIAAVIAAVILGRPIALLVNNVFSLGWMSAVLTYIAVFLIALLVFSILCLSLKSIKIPIISTLDKILGLCLGILIGVLSAATVATVAHSFFEFISTVSGNQDVMNCYYGSRVFKFVNEIGIFGFIRSLA